MNVEFLLALLGGTRNGTISVGSLSEEIGVSSEMVEERLASLVGKDLVTNFDGTHIDVTEGQRLHLATYAIKEGVDIERVCAVLGWAEFEDLVAFALYHREFEVKKHFRVKQVMKRYEIDLVGLKEPLVLSIECKHWKRSWRRAATIDVINTQIKRTKALVQSIPEPKDKLGVGKWHEVNFIPLVLTLSNTPIKIYEGVPVVPIFKFNTFLDEMLTNLDELMVLTMMSQPRLT